MCSIYLTVRDGMKYQAWYHLQQLNVFYIPESEKWTEVLNKVSPQTRMIGRFTTNMKNGQVFECMAVKYRVKPVTSPTEQVTALKLCT